MVLTGALTEVGEFEVRDIDECAEAHAPWEMRHTQLSLGEFRGHTAFVRNKRVTVYRQQWNRKILACGTSPADYFVVGTTTYSSASINWCGRDLSRERLAWTAPTGDIDFTSSEFGDHVVALVRNDVLADYFGDAAWAAEPHALHINCPERAGRKLVATIQSILTRYASQPSLTDPRDSQDFESEVLSALTACANWKSPANANRSQRREATRDACAYAETQHKPISVPQLADAVGVSARTLEYAFRENLGTTPLNFIRRCRLNSAHRELRSAMMESNTVTEIATRWGFNDLGRFAGAYRQLFGFYPSQTLSQNRSPIAYLEA